MTYLKKRSLALVIGLVTSFLWSMPSHAEISATEGLVKETSGILYGFYQVERCSPRYASQGFAGACNTGYFKKSGTKGIITADATGFTAGDVQISQNLTGTITSTTKAIDIFAGISTVEIQGEGVFTLKISLVDRAYNSSYFEIIYKVDKTAPVVTGFSAGSSMTIAKKPDPYLTMTGNLYQFESTSAFATGLVYEAIYKFNENGTFQINATEPLGHSYQSEVGKAHATSGTILYPYTAISTKTFTQNSETSPSKNYFVRVYDNTISRTGKGNYRDFPINAIMTNDDGTGATNFGAQTGTVVVGLSNLKAPTVGKANVNLTTKITRYSLLSDFKKSVELNSRGITWCTSSDVLNWSDFLKNVNNSNYKKCTITVGNEVISFIKGNIDLDCSGDCKLASVNRSIIVKDGSIHIKSNLSTYGNSRQLLLGSITSNGLTNVSMSSISRANMKGWVLLDPSVTNIDAFLVSEGPIVNYKGTKLINDPLTINNQLHIYGGLLSLNTTDSTKLPYIIQGTTDGSFFNLQEMRTYKLEGVCTPGAGNICKRTLKPSNGAIRSGNLTSPILATKSGDFLYPTQGDTCKPGLRCITDKDYLRYNVLIEKNTAWTTSPSALFKPN